MSDYSTVTETPGDPVRKEAISMMVTRYVYASTFCEGKRVLEVGAGAGQGLGILSRGASLTVGGDYTRSLVVGARRHYGDRYPLVQFDGQAMPFRDGSFDVVILYEAIYYVPKPREFFAEARRLLAPRGRLLLCSANCECADFNPSPHSHRYFSARELSEELGKAAFDVELRGAYRVEAGSARDVVISLFRRTAVAMNLVPRTMRGKALLKRLFYGRLSHVPPELSEEMAEPLMPVPLRPNGAVSEYKVLYAVARRRD